MLKCPNADCGETTPEMIDITNPKTFRCITCGQRGNPHHFRQESMNQNSNCLQGMACPKCGSLQPFVIEANKQFLVYDTGTEDMCSDTHWNKKSYCRCQECDFDGKVQDFQITNQGAKRTIKLAGGSMAQFVESIARMKRDRELLPDGNEYDMVSDDAVETLNSLISQARELDQERLLPRQADEKGSGE